MEPNSDKIMFISSRVIAKNVSNTGHHNYTRTSHQATEPTQALEYYSTIPGNASNPCPLAPHHQLSNKGKAEYRISFFSIHPEPYEPNTEQESLTEQ